MCSHIKPEGLTSSPLRGPTQWLVYNGPQWFRLYTASPLRGSTRLLDAHPCPRAHGFGRGTMPLVVLLLLNATDRFDSDRGAPPRPARCLHPLSPLPTHVMALARAALPTRSAFVFALLTSASPCSVFAQVQVGDGCGGTPRTGACASRVCWILCGGALAAVYVVWAEHCARHGRD